MGAILLRKIFVQLYISNCVIIRFIRELINKITHKLQTLSEDWDGNPPFSEFLFWFLSTLLYTTLDFYRARSVNRWPVEGRGGGTFQYFKSQFKSSQVNSRVILVNFVPLRHGVTPPKEIFNLHGNAIFLPFLLTYMSIMIFKSIGSPPRPLVLSIIDC